MPERHIPRKRFGQHFLIDEHIIQQIIRAIAPQSSDHLLEIGPGPGILTQHLVDRVKQLDLVEIDHDLVKALATKYTQDHVHIHSQDVLQFDVSSIVNPSQKIRVVGNLPYNISTPLMFHLLKQAPLIEDMYFLLQQEVVNRITATPGNKQYGRLSIMIQYFCSVASDIHVPASAFNPPPKVESKTVRLVPHQQLPHIANDFSHFSMVVKTAFSYRRKTIHNALKNLIDTTELQTIDINPSLRPENLSLEQYIRISNEIPLK
jgi:16S rRNA (adenine1518-N6/adenine1519-N6)-dimethyltransferase